MATKLKHPQKTKKAKSAAKQAKKAQGTTVKKSLNTVKKTTKKTANKTTKTKSASKKVVKKNKTATKSKSNKRAIKSKMRSIEKDKTNNPDNIQDKSLRGMDDLELPPLPEELFNNPKKKKGFFFSLFKHKDDTKNDNDNTKKEIKNARHKFLNSNDKSSSLDVNHETKEKIKKRSEIGKKGVTVSVSELNEPFDKNTKEKIVDASSKDIKSDLDALDVKHHDVLAGKSLDKSFNKIFDDFTEGAVSGKVSEKDLNRKEKEVDKFVKLLDKSKQKINKTFIKLYTELESLDKVIVPLKKELARVNSILRRLSPKSKSRAKYDEQKQKLVGDIYDLLVKKSKTLASSSIKVLNPESFKEFNEEIISQYILKIKDKQRELEQRSKEVLDISDIIAEKQQEFAEIKNKLDMEKSELDDIKQQKAKIRNEIESEQKKIEQRKKELQKQIKVFEKRSKIYDEKQKRYNKLLNELLQIKSRLDDQYYQSVTTLKSLADRWEKKEEYLTELKSQLVNAIPELNSLIKLAEDEKHNLEIKGKFLKEQAKKIENDKKDLIRKEKEVAKKLDKLVKLEKYNNEKEKIIAKKQHELQLKEKKLMVKEKLVIEREIKLKNVKELKEDIKTLEDRRNEFEKELVKVTKELEKLKTKEAKINEKLKTKEKELMEYKERLDKKAKELDAKEDYITNLQYYLLKEKAEMEDEEFHDYVLDEMNKAVAKDTSEGVKQQSEDAANMGKYKEANIKFKELESQEDSEIFALLSTAREQLKKGNVIAAEELFKDIEKKYNDLKNHKDKQSLYYDILSLKTDLQLAKIK